MKKRIAVLCSPGLGNFVAYIVRHLKRQNFEVQYLESNDLSQIGPVIKWANVVWLEWGNKLAIAVTNHQNILDGKKVICRVHSYEVFNDLVAKINWGVVDDCIFVADHIRDLALAQFPNLKQAKRIRVIQDGVDLANFRFQSRKPGGDIAFVAHLSSKKGLILLLQAFASLVKKGKGYWHLHIAGDWQELREKVYFEHMTRGLGLQNHITCYGWVDNLSDWLIDKQYIISTSPVESRGWNIVEAMATGIMPLIHNFVGAKDLYPEEFIWNTVDDFVHLILNKEYDPQRYAKLAREKWKVGDQLNQYTNAIQNLIKPTKKKKVPGLTKSAKNKKKNPPVTISVCMMMKNESENLARCLDSVNEIADEIIIVDTGSTDNSIEIAESYGARVIIPDNLDGFFVDTEFGKKLNFSKARNESLKHAIKEWILVIDADEELTLESPILPVVNLKGFLSDILPRSCDAVSFNLKDMQEDKVAVEFLIPKLFRNGKVSYRNIVHNEPIFKGVTILFEHGYFKHYGYALDEDGRNAKHERTVGLLNKRLKDNPSDFKTHFHLAQSYGYTAKDNYLEKMIFHCKEYIKTRQLNTAFNDSIYYTLIQALMKDGKADESFEWLRAARQLLPDDLDLAYVQIEFGKWVGQPHLITEGCNEFLRIYSIYDSNPVVKGGRFVFTHNKDAKCFALYNLTVTELGHGANHLVQLKQILPEVGIEFRSMIENDLGKQLGNSGVSLIN